MDCLDLLREEIKKPDHWLEGIYLQRDLRNEDFRGANMPRCVFEGAHLESIALDHANLQGAIFRSATLSSVSFCHAKLLDAIFDRAVFTPISEFSVDLRDADLGGATFSGASLVAVRMQGVQFSKPTNVAYLLHSPSFEETTGDWEDAASIYTALGKRARDDWDILLEDSASFSAMACKHRQMIKGRPASGTSYLAHWIVPTIRSGPTGLWWYLQRMVWGYGYRPMRLVLAMLAIVAIFAAIFVGVCGASLQDSILLSAQSFFTFTYGKCVPADGLGEAIGTLEAFLGTTLIALFVVSLATRFMRRI